MLTRCPRCFRSLPDSSAGSQGLSRQAGAWRGLRGSHGDRCRRRSGTGRRGPALHASCMALLSLCLALPGPGLAAEPSKLEESRNYHFISDALLTAGQIYPTQIPALKDKGVEFVINLAIADPERNGEEAFAIAGAGISYVNIPVLWDGPTEQDLQLFFDVMDARGGRRTLVHCFANFRASAFTFLYRVLREGVPLEEARRDLLAVWDSEFFAKNPVWRTFIDEQLAAHRS
jgi:protein tyrosine phosphatase (PTP) superfamily phosphohydrolase (DUF442 family)